MPHRPGDGPPFTAERKLTTPWHAHHIAERYGLLAIIAVGEFLTGAIETLRAIVANHGWSVDAALVGFGGTALAFGMW
jgi:low temperature requirement protein LtrA